MRRLIGILLQQTIENISVEFLNKNDASCLNASEVSIRTLSHPWFSMRWNNHYGYDLFSLDSVMHDTGYLDASRFYVFRERFDA